MNSSNTTEQGHRVVSRDEWLKARLALLEQEKEWTHRRDEISRQRRELPWVKIDKQYTFDSPQGKVTLAELFAGRGQLATYHFMLGPDWEEGCPGCSFLSDHLDGSVAHLNERDVTLVMVSRAPLAKIEGFKKRMGWRFPWVSSHGSDFNRDFGVTFTAEELTGGSGLYNFGTVPPYGEETPGLSVFARDARGGIFHTYSTYARGLEPLLSTYAILDLVPKGRDEEALNPPMSWVRHHDKYAHAASQAASCCHSVELKP